MVIVNPTWRNSISIATGDHTDLGIVMEVDIQLNESTLKILGNYWPSNNTHGQSSLWAAVVQYMEKNNIAVNGTDAVTNYVRRIVENKVLKHMENPKNACIIGGDFNAGWRTDECKKFTERSHHKFRQWTEQLGLQNDLAEAHDNNFYTFRRGEKIKTFIDHILTSNNAEFVLGGSNQLSY